MLCHCGLYPLSSALHECCRAIIAEAMDGELEFQFFHAWFNVVFLASAFLTLSLFYAQHKRDRDADLPMYVSRRD